MRAPLYPLGVAGHCYVCLVVLSARLATVKNCGASRGQDFMRTFIPRFRARRDNLTRTW